MGAKNQGNDDHGYHGKQLQRHQMVTRRAYSIQTGRRFRMSQVKMAANHEASTPRGMEMGPLVTATVAATMATVTVVK